MHIWENIMFQRAKVFDLSKLQPSKYLNIQDIQRQMPSSYLGYSRHRGWSDRRSIYIYMVFCYYINHQTYAHRSNNKPKSKIKSLKMENLDKLLTDKWGRVLRKKYIKTPFYLISHPVLFLFHIVLYNKDQLTDKIPQFEQTVKYIENEYRNYTCI